MKAYELLEVHGWCQGAFFRDKNGLPCSVKEMVSCCLVGVLGLTYEKFADYKIARNKLEEILGTKLSIFNDTPGRTKEEVVTLLKKADI